MADRRPPLETPRLDAAALRRRLGPWYRRRRRDLPWRATRDPYAIWLSEVMLQQTQVATATPYYHRFLERFPTLASLARARGADVLAAWSGLGYYRRARHFHEAARVVMREHAGHVPDAAEAFGRLPGVGRYTTGAVLSIAFDRPLPVLDGNVARVLSRLAALPAAVRDPRGARALWALAGQLVPMRGAGDWNQALMELGATICTPRTPQCPACPVRSQCRALALGRVEAFPPVMARRAPRTLRQAMARIEWRGRLLVTRREGTLLGGLWEPPAVEVAPGDDPGRALRGTLAALGLRATIAPSGERVTHVLTHRVIEADVWRGTLREAPPRTARVRTVDAGRPSVPLTGLAKKVARLETRAVAAPRRAPAR